VYHLSTKQSEVERTTEKLRGIKNRLQFEAVNTVNTHNDHARLSVFQPTVGLYRPSCTVRRTEVRSAITVTAELVVTCWVRSQKTANHFVG